MKIKKNFLAPTNSLDAFILALLINIIFFLLLYVLFSIILDGSMQRLYSLLGGDWPIGFIQFSTFFAFFWCMIMLGAKQRKIKWESQALALNLLPDDEHTVLLPKQINELRKLIADKNEWSDSIFYKILFRASTKFRANQSAQETLDVVKVQSDIELMNQESSYGIIRYLAWAIPSIGFIGTVFGISAALSSAGQAMTGDISAITIMLGTAFDTTMVSLFLSVVLMFQLHRIQQSEEQLIINIQDYIIENFVNRIYVPRN